MPAPATCDQLLELIDKSLLIEKERIDAYLVERPDRPADAREFANQLWRDGILTFYQARMLLTGKYKGFVFGKYKVLEQIGAGGEGNVYLCEHLLMRRRVAVKVLPIDRAADQGLLERFYREARAAAALDHPNIVRVHDIDQVDDLHFLVMEYVDGNSLQRVVKKKGPMEILRAVNYIRQSAIGLQHVHQAGLVHRDIKPGNLLLERTGTVKILDLGLARFFQDSKDALTQQFDESAILGTADYISPEQGMNSHAADIRADIYSLGATFYYLLAGRAPFDGGTVTQKLLFHQIREPDPIRTVRVAVPEAMAQVLQKMMAKDMAKRYQTPVEVVQALDGWYHEITAPPEDEMPKLSSASNVNPADGGPLSRTLGTISMSTNGGARRKSDPVSTKKLQAGKTLAPSEKLPMAVVLPDPKSRPIAKASGALVPAPRTAKPLAVAARPAVVDVAESRRAPSEKRRRAGSGRRFKLRAGALSKRNQYIVLGSVAALVLGIGGYFLLPLMIGNWKLGSAVDKDELARRTPAPVANPQPRSPAPASAGGNALNVVVSNDGGQKSLRDALNQATPGSRITIFAQDAFHEEIAEIDGKVANDITIEGSTRDGRVLTWRPPGNANPGQALLRLANAEGLKFKGIVFDGQDKLDDLIVLSGRCPGVTLEGTVLSGFRRRGVVFRDCVGETRKPVSLLRARLTTNRDVDAALSFEGTGNRDFDIRDCRFEGPFRSAFQIAGSVANAGFHRNRIYRAQTGLHYRRANPPHRAHLELVSNTFYEVSRGMHFETLPPGGDKNEIVVQKNVFARCPTPAQVDEFTPEPDVITAQWIWHNEPGDPGKAAMPGASYYRKTFTLPEQTFSGVHLNIVCDDTFVLYVNGQLAGEGEFKPAARRVFSIDVSRFLKGGANVIAVTGTNRTGSRGATPAGLFAQLSTLGGANPILAVTDGSWKSSKTNDPGWQTEKFNDQAWQPVRVLASYGKGDASWQNLVWDQVLTARSKSGSLPFQNASANIHDVPVRVAFPSLEWQGMDVTFSTDAGKDQEFLRYRRNHPLFKAGPGGSPIGAPPVD